MLVSALVGQTVCNAPSCKFNHTVTDACDLTAKLPKEIFCLGGGKVWICEMSYALSSPVRAGYSEMIAKLISAGYLPSDQRHDPDAITNAIARMKLDLRTGNGSVLGRK